MFLIIPYRDRKEDLDKMLDTIKKLKKEWNKDIKILLCEQINNEKFNKGKLINCGIHYLRSINFNSTIIIHDVDIYPKLNAQHLYENSNSMCHLYGLNHCFGGVMLSNIKNFIDVNGYSNKYIGWGREDTDFKARCEHFNLHIDNSRFQERYNSSFFEENKNISKRKHNLNNINYYDKCKKNPSHYLKDGLSNILSSNYSVEIKKDYIWIKVKNNKTSSISNKTVIKKIKRNIILKNKNN